MPVKRNDAGADAGRAPDEAATEPAAAHALNHPGLSAADRDLLRKLRRRRRDQEVARDKRGRVTAGAKTADWVAEHVGSWRFILAQSALLAVWIAVNALAWTKAWDPYPFILLNLVLSFQAAYTAPIIMMSQNRAAAMDRRRAQDDYDVNLKAELEIELLHQKIDLLREQEIVVLIDRLEQLHKRLEHPRG